LRFALCHGRLLYLATDTDACHVTFAFAFACAALAALGRGNARKV
jgi:hypothetical protein